MPPLEPAECAAMARRAADRVDAAMLPRASGGASFVLWEDEESIAWLNVHRMHHGTGAVTVHVYSPPLRAIGYYEVTGGLLQRTPGSPGEASPGSPRLLASLADR